MSTNEISVDTSLIERGSIIQTYNKAIKKDFLMVVLAVTDVYTCIKLTDNALFRRVNNIRIDISDLELDSSKFKSSVTMYANVFGGTSIIKPEYVTKVHKTLKIQEYYGIVASMISYYTGFYHIDVDTGEYVIDTPYIRDPIYTMLFGMVPVSEVINQEVTSKNKNVKNVETDTKKEIDKKSDGITRVRRSSDVKKVFEDLSKYPDNMTLRIESLFKAFSAYLLDGKFPIKQVGDAILGQGLKLPRRNSILITREEFAYIITHNATEISKQFGVKYSSANYIRRTTELCYNGKKTKYLRIRAELTEYLEEAYKANPLTKRGDIIADLMEKFDISEEEASRAQFNYIKRNPINSKRPYTYERAKDTDDKLLRILDFNWIKAFDRRQELQDTALAMFKDVNSVYSGATKIDTGDIVFDALLLYSLTKVVNTNQWMMVVTLPVYKEFRAKFAKYSFSDIRKRFDLTNRNVARAFPTSAIIILYIVCCIEEMDEKQIYLHKSVGVGNTKYNPNYLCKPIGIAHRDYRVHTFLGNYMANKFGLNKEQVYTLIKACVKAAENVDIGIRKYSSSKRKRIEEA